MNKAYIKDEEVLYRAILRRMPNPIINGKPMASIFMDSKKEGTSVDREGGREPSKVFDSLKDRFNRKGKDDQYIGAVTVTANQCRKVKLYPVPVGNKKFHAEIHESETIEAVSIEKAMLLAMRCNLHLME